MPDGPYGLTARMYWDAGWQPLPLPAGKKFPPPKGFTGKTAFHETLTTEHVAAWSSSRRLGNIALRMPNGAAAIDVDAYLKGGKVKDGEKTLRQLIETYEPIPKTVMSTARPDSVGQLLYRLPTIDHPDFPAELGGMPIVLPGVLGPGIEAIQHHHRYSVVWPSTNPDADGAVYRWYLPDEDYDGDDFWEHRILAPEGYIPRLEDLPELPEAWCHIVSLGSKGGVVRAESASPLGTYEIHHLMNDWAQNDDLDPRLTANILDTYQADVRRGKARHDSCMKALTWACKAGAAGLIDPGMAISTLESMFGADTHDRYVPGEFASMLAWAAANGPTDATAYRANWDERKERRTGPVPNTDESGLWAGQEVGSNVVSIPEQRTTTPVDQDIPPFTGRTHRTVVGSDGQPSSVATDEYKAYLAKYHGSPRAEGETRVQAAPLAEEKKEDRFKSLDWDEAFATDFTNIDWLPGKICERGQQIAVVGSGKVGKSMFMFDWMYRAITGKTFLGDQRRPPVKVLYLDKENSLRDIVTRMKALGATPDELRDNFVYKLHPSFTGGLDQGGTAVMELSQIVDQERPDVIVFDTVSRFIGGKENDSDTWIQFYRQVHANLKRLGIAGIRLDHMGKDETKGSRGSSAKSQDVDHVWEMTKVDEARSMGANGAETVTTVLCMTRTHTRTGIGPDELNVSRIGVKFGDMWADGQTKHTVLDREAVKAAKSSVQAYVDELIDNGVPKLGRDKLKAWAAEKGIALPGNNEAMGKIVKAVGHYHAEKESLAS
ncbi:AAA family ATPase [Streptomyces sp. NPDC001507]|uniref:AAA family ATPase n=1 Tax=Streptomyces sp. NPDC001507 TaxID=3364579 RepID=UPI0036A84E37